MVDLTTGFNTQQIGATATQSMNVIWLVLLWVMVAALFFGIIIFAIWWNSFKIKFRVWIVTGTKSLCVDDVAKVIRKKGQAPKWKLRGRKDFVPIPEDDCISINKKGRMVVEAYYTENGQYIYKKNINSPQLDINDPLTTIDKEFYLNEHIDAVNKYKKKSVFEMVMQLAPMLGVILIVILLFAFWGEIVQPFKEVGQMIIEERQKDREFYQEMHDIHKVVVGGKGNNSIYSDTPFGNLLPTPN